MAESERDTATGRDGDGEDMTVDAAEGSAVTGTGASGAGPADVGSAGAGSGGAVLSAAAREWVRRTVAGLEPLTQEERDYLAYMFQRRL